MKKRFKTIFCIFFSIFMMFAVSCEEPLEIEEYIAQMEEYGEWDGNYMYRGNVKAKTSGEDEELCLPEVIYKDQTYLLDELNDIGEFYYLENDQVLFFANAKLKTDDTTQEQPDNSIESQNYEQENATTLYMLIKYSYKEKSYEIIYAFENINLNNNLKLIFVKKNIAVISWAWHTTRVFLVDIQEKSLQTITCNDEITVLNDCLIILNKKNTAPSNSSSTSISDFDENGNPIYKENSVYYVPYRDCQIRYLFTLDANAKDITLNEYDRIIDGTPLVSLYANFKVNNEYTINQYYLNAQTEKLFHVDTLCSLNHYYYALSDNVFIMGEIKTITTFEGYKDKVAANCKLFKLSYANDELSCDEVYAFPKRLHYSSSLSADDNFFTFKFISGRFLGNNTYKCYSYDATTGQINRISFSKFDDLRTKKTAYIITCGEWIYSFDSYSVHKGCGSKTLRIFKGTNTTTGEKRILQTFVYPIYDDESYETKYAQNIFSNDPIYGFTDSDFIYIKILPY